MLNRPVIVNYQDGWHESNPFGTSNGKVCDLGLNLVDATPLSKLRA
jgi:hypothetical protein